jgi:hypothetical protein
MIQEQRGHVTSARLLDCGAAIGPLFITTALVVSALALGPSGWIQTANFLTAGTLTCLFALGTRRSLQQGRGSNAVPTLIGAVGVGLLGAGIWATDPVSGYPPDAPDRVSGRTRRGALHELSAVPVMLGIPASAFVYGRRCAARGDRRWARYCTATALVSLIAFVASGIGFGQVAALTGRAGMLQRIGIVTGFSWLTALAVHLRCAPIPQAHGTLLTRVTNSSDRR